MGNSSSSSYYYNNKFGSNSSTTSTSYDVRANITSETSSADETRIGSSNTHNKEEIYNENTTNTATRRNIIASKNIVSDEKDPAIDLNDINSQQQQEVWKGPFGEIIHPREAAMLLGSSTTRRITRAFRRVIALDQLPISNYSNPSSRKYYMETRYLRHGIFCYEDTALSTSAAGSSHANTNSNNISDTTNSNTNPNASSSMELVFLNEENTMEAKDLNAIMDWFFQPTGKTIANNKNYSSTPSSPSNIWIDFLSFKHLILPPHAEPPPGILDCIFASMATPRFVIMDHGTGRTTSNNNSPPLPPIVRLPDYLSFVAILQKGTPQQKSIILFKVYQSLQLLRNRNRNNATTADHPSSRNVVTNSKSTITRDTITRFIFNVYGNDVLQKDETQQLLLEFFSSLEEDSTISLDKFVSKISFFPTPILTEWLDVWVSRTLCPPLTDTQIFQMEEYYSSNERKLQLICARYSITPIMMLECKRKFYSILQLLVEPQSSASTTTTTTKQQQKLISFSKFLQVCKGYLPNLLAKLTFIAGCSSSCNCLVHHNNRHHSKRNTAKQVDTAPSSGVESVLDTSINEDIDQGSSFSTLHRTYSAVHPQGLDMIAAASNTSNNPVVFSDTTSSAVADNSNKNIAMHGTISDEQQQNSFNYCTDTPSSSSSSLCTCSWTLYDSIAFCCAAVRTSCCRSNGLADNNGVEQVTDLALLQFVFRVFVQEENDGNTFWKIDEWSNDNEQQPSNNDIVEPSLSKKKIGRMILLLLEHYHFRNRIDHSCSLPTTSIEHEANTPEKNKRNFFVFRNSQICVFRKDAVSMGFIPEEQEEEGAGGKSPESHEKNATTIPLLQVVEIILNEVSSSDAIMPTIQRRMTFSQFVYWQQKSHRSYKNNNNNNLEQQRLGLYLRELRLLAGVAFGVRPSSPTQEQLLTRVLFRRHKLGHPESPTNPRGPPGTTWYLVSSDWMDQWNSFSSSAVYTANGLQQQHQQIRAVNKHETEKSSDSTVTPGNKTVPATGGNTVQINHFVESAFETSSPPPLSIDNNFLLREGSLVLRSNLRHPRDFLLVPPLVWDALQAWYDGGPPIERTVVKRSPDSASSAISVNDSTTDQPFIIPIVVESDVELYPFCLTIALADTATGQPRPFQQWQLVSRIEPAQSLLSTLCFSLRSSPENSRLWKISSQKMGHDNTSSCRLLDLNLSLNNQIERADEAAIIMLEIRGEDGVWPRSRVVEESRPSTLSAADSLTRFENTKNEVDDEGDGIVGLYNMGNTCYLNSSMQCLSHTPLLREYFTSKSYLSDINTTNPLGFQGRLAQVSAMLLIQLWKPNTSGSALTPKSFKDALGKFNDHFAGNEQHDAQELLAFLLSGLSEDLNRIVDKPYIEQPDSDGRPDSELADIWWKNHLLREMSIIVALFTGQYKSLLTCKTCGYESARFEPFAFLQLPLQEDELIPIALIVYPIDRHKPVLRYSVRVNKDGTIDELLITLCKMIYQDELSSLRTSDSKTINNDDNRDLKRNLLRKSPNVSSVNGADDEKDLDDDDYFFRQMASNYAVVDMRECRIHSITPSSRSLSQVRESDILCVYEIDPMRTETQYVDTTLDSAISSDQNSDPSSLPVITDDDPVSVPKPLVITLRSDYIALVQRRLEPLGHPYLQNFTMRVFGVPLLLRVILREYTGSQLYDLIAERIHRFVPVADDEYNKLQQLTPTTRRQTPNYSSTSSVHDEPSEIETKKKSLQVTTMDLVEVAGGPMPRHGFRLRLASRDGRHCSRCLWYECCVGCEIPDDAGPTAVQDGDTVVIDWHLSSAASRHRIDGVGASASAGKEQTISHASVERHLSCRFDGKDITLEECLDKFTKEEEIPDAYCSKCKDFCSSTKHMRIWRLPPIMIIHLKRFQFTQHFRRKLRNMVVFPVEGLDLSRIVVSDDGNLGDKKISHVSATTRAAEDGSYGLFHNDEAEVEPSQEDAAWVNNSENGRPSESLYDLYAVVHHLGALSGGHYVASIKSEKDGKWRIFNDAQVTEISSRDIVDASAYILFYLRRDVRHIKLEDLWETSSRMGEGLTEDQIDKLVKERNERCVVS